MDVIKLYGGIKTYLNMVMIAWERRQPEGLVARDHYHKGSVFNQVVNPLFENRYVLCIHK